MLGIPNETPYDLRFRLLGIPVRVHPLFWLISAILGWRGQEVSNTLLWVGCVFVSILVHEFGHGLTSKLFGFRPFVVLYGMGGLCYSEAERQSPGQRLLVLFAGPGAGFLLAGAIFLGWLLAGMPPLGPVADRVVLYLMYINLFWGALNLLPIWPLDGGQIAGVILSWLNRANGMRWMHVVSLLISGLLAIFVYSWTRDVFYSLFFGYFAVMNYQVLNAYHQGYRAGLNDDDRWS